MNIRRTLLLFGLLIALSGVLARAQYEDGSLIGSIHDASGAAVANAAVTITNTSTGIATRINANAVGDYEAPVAPRRRLHHRG